MCNGMVVKKKVGFKRYGYWKVFSFRYLSWFLKASQGYKIYQQDIAKLKKKLDLKDFLINQGKINIISNLIMKPYQIKLLSTFEKQEEAEDDAKEGAEEGADSQPVTIENALERVAANSHYYSEFNASCI